MLNIIFIYKEMAVIYYKLSQAILFSNPGSYIVGWFKNNGYCFILFDDFEEFMQKKKNYKSLHELIIYPTGTTLNTSFMDRKDGRLCFDFDLKKSDNAVFDTSKWIDDIEKTIKIVCSQIYKNVNLSDLKYVWSTSNNPAKISKHLTVNGIFFEDWIDMTQQFYNYFIKIWNDNYDYYNAESFIDKQIVRKNGSLRFVGCTKPDGSSLLTLDNNNFTFEMSLIRPILTWDKTDEQCISYDKLVYPCHLHKKISIVVPLVDRHNIIHSIKYDDDTYLKAFKIRNKYETEDGIIINYDRKEPSFCKMCNKIHDSENAYVKIVDGIASFYCYRNSEVSMCIKVNTDDKKSTGKISNDKKSAGKISENETKIPKSFLTITI
ncbi:hypothetical protein QJ857_gp1091 [Tupanvirus soda lake]|uniref:Uncharacterized protein n=2 Tax=Tupanvirus TaxID=2094720 RepID=A0A6N1NU11_9VIRU|nr:hypothetical protein QJ857_gp1091 [Tupanvirus soda lake]QKU34963.1 hypothetical protein [Tupanvirus soda lake]